jgi:hypothetical protein
MGAHFSQPQFGMVSFKHRLKTPEPVCMILLWQLTVQDGNSPFLFSNKFAEKMSRGLTDGPRLSSATKLWRADLAS